MNILKGLVVFSTLTMCAPVLADEFETDYDQGTITFGGVAAQNAFLRAIPGSSDMYLNANNDFQIDVGTGKYLFQYDGNKVLEISGNVADFGWKDSGAYISMDKSIDQIFLDSDIRFNKTITAGGTTGDQTINDTTFSVNFAAVASSLTVTNSLAKTTSIILCQVRTNDSTMFGVKVETPTDGSIVIYPNAAPTAETRVDCQVTN